MEKSEEAEKGKVNEINVCRELGKWFLFSKVQIGTSPQAHRSTPLGGHFTLGGQCVRGYETRASV